MVPPLQELLMDPGLGRAATKTAMEAAAKLERASLENMVKMSGRLGNLGLQVVDLETKGEVGCSIGGFTMSLYRFVFSSFRICGAEWSGCLDS